MLPLAPPPYSITFLIDSLPESHVLESQVAHFGALVYLAFLSFINNLSI